MRPASSRGSTGSKPGRPTRAASMSRPIPWRASLRRDVISLLLEAKNGTLKVRLLADTRDDVGHVRRALELSAADLEPIVLYIDPDSALVEKRAFAANAPGRPLVEEQFSDYR